MLDNILLLVRKKWGCFLSRLNADHPTRNEKLYNKLALLYPDGNLDKLYEYYTLKRMKHVLAIIICGLFLVSLYYLTPNSPSTNLKRPSYNEPSITQDVELTIFDGTDERKLSLTINIEPKSLSFDEALLLVDTNKPYIEKLLISENISPKHIDTPLNFVEYIDGLDFHITWEIQTDGLIRYDGSLIGDNISSTGSLCKLIAQITVSGYTFNIPFSVVVFPPTETSIDISTQIDNYINSDTLRQEDTVDLSVLNNLALIRDIQIATPKLVSPIILLSFVAIAAVLIYHQTSSNLDEQLKKRKDNLLRDYPEISSKLALLTFAGLSVEHAFKKIVSDYDARQKFDISKKSIIKKHNSERFVYKEIRLTLRQISAGQRFGSYHEFGKRCNLPCYMKLATLIEQHVNKGTKEFRALLDKEVQDSFQEQKAYYKEMGERASTKLLIPMIIMMIVVFIIIMVPAFMNMSLSTK